MNINSFGKANEDEVQNLEGYLGFSLPDDYRNFLKNYNGGTSKVRYSKFRVKELNENIPLDVLYGINVDQTFNLAECYEEFGEDLLPKSLIIGDDPGSGLIVLIHDSENDGVYYWDHAFFFDQSDEDGNIYKIAGSFSSFINGLEHP
ncbi:SMI1/KNR4 family protein [Halobacillus hunanensis]|uniref:SMI1/KNR4 family protein n=1 Tax=Halobacillus hunanensis TaxID=578214 RepID=UPI0009A599AC|nr:SMI1/KNR4 family protein [Halobacillus hunanensis]